jgi:tetratricopeptide (TPR) repeat protein
MQSEALSEQLLQQVIAARDQGRLDQAAALLDRAEQAHPGGVGLLAERAQLLYARGRYPEAFQQIRQAIAAKPPISRMIICFWEASFARQDIRKTRTIATVPASNYAPAR